MEAVRAVRAVQILTQRERTGQLLALFPLLIRTRVTLETATIITLQEVGLATQWIHQILHHQYPIGQPNAILHAAILLQTLHGLQKLQLGVVPRQVN